MLGCFSLYYHYINHVIQRYFLSNVLWDVSLTSVPVHLCSPGTLNRFPVEYSLVEDQVLESNKLLVIQGHAETCATHTIKYKVRSSGLGVLIGNSPWLTTNKSPNVMSKQGNGTRHSSLLTLSWCEHKKEHCCLITNLGLIINNDVTNIRFSQYTFEGLIILNFALITTPDLLCQWFLYSTISKDKHLGPTSFVATFTCILSVKFQTATTLSHNNKESSCYASEWLSYLFYHTRQR